MSITPCEPDPEESNECCDNTEKYLEESSKLHVMLLLRVVNVSSRLIVSCEVVRCLETGPVMRSWLSRAGQL
jgi:hypothetical protein